jgi:hypothetical protein
MRLQGGRSLRGRSLQNVGLPGRHYGVAEIPE